MGRGWTRERYLRYKDSGYFSPIDQTSRQSYGSFSSRPWHFYGLQDYSSSSCIIPQPLHSPPLTYHRLVTKVLADHDPTSTSCFTVTRTSLPDDCPHCAQPQIRELKTHTIPCGCPPALPTTVVSVPCPTKCSPTGLISWTSTSASCETTESELPKQSQPGTLTVDVSQVTIASKVKCVKITKTDGPSCTVTPTPPCPTQSLCTSVSTIKVTNYCGCDGIKETTICRTNCKLFYPLLVVPSS
jgi:hypothetical protein